MKNIFLQFLFALLFLSTSLFGQSNAIHFISHPNASTQPVLSNDFYTVSHLQLSQNVVLNDKENILLDVNGTTLLQTNAVASKMFANNYQVRIQSATGLQSFSLQDIGFDGRYFSGKNAAGQTNACFSWFENQIEFAWAAGSNEYFIEPLSKYVSSAPKDEYIYYTKADIKPTNATCGTNSTHNKNVPQGSGTSANCFQVEYAIVADYSMFVKYGSVNATINRTVSITNLMQTDYFATDGFSNDICYKIVEHYVPTCATCNPWPSSVDITVNLDNITNIPATFFVNNFDVATYYFDGTDPMSNTVGLAWLGAVCVDSFKCNAIRDYSASTNNMRQLVSHELGHNWNALHDTNNAPFIMAPLVNGTSVWSPASIADMDAYMLNAPCLDPCPSTIDQCDTAGTYITSITNDPVFGRLTIKWLNIPGVQYTFRTYDIAAGTWSTIVTLGANVDSVRWNYNSSMGAACQKNYILEIGPYCPLGQNNFGASVQIVYNVSKYRVPSITITPTGGTAVCNANNLAFTSTLTNQGTGFTLQWYKNGVLIPGATSPSYTALGASLNTNDNYYCILTSGLACALPQTDTSNVVTITVTNAATPSIGITTTNTTVCAGATVNFFAVATNQGTTPIFQWKKNGVNVGTNSNTYSSNALVTGDQITCVLTSNKTCITTTTVTSAIITMTVNQSVQPVVTISSPNATGCSGATTVNFTATPTNGGATPVYVWRANGIIVGTNSPTFTSTTLVSGDVVNCTMTSNAFCAVPNKDTSADIIVTVLPAVTPSVSIVSDVNPTCGSTTVNFTATPVFGGTTPSYQWKKNGVNVGIDSSWYGVNFLSNGDVITCEMTSSQICAVPSLVTSNSITMSIVPAVTPTISILATPGNTICAGQIVSYNATISNGGASPSFIWKINGVPVSPVNNAPTLSGALYSIPNGSLVSVIMTSNAGCVTAANASSNTLPLTIKPIVTPTIVINGNKTTICQGDLVNFASSATITGANPFFQWKVNGNNVGSSSASFNTNALPVGVNTITCTMTSSSNQCLNAPNVTSNGFVVTVNPNLVPDIQILNSANNVCYGTSIQFSSTIINGGSAPVYQWKVNGLNVAGNSNFINTVSLNNGDVVTCVLTSNETCLAKAKDTSNAISMIIKPLVSTFVAIVRDTDYVCANDLISFNVDVSVNGGVNPAYMWYLNNVATGNSSTSFSSTSFVNGDKVHCTMISTVDCPSPAVAKSNVDTIHIYPPAIPNITISSSDTDFCIGNNILFKSFGVDTGSAPTYKWFWNGLQVGPNFKNYNTTLLETNDSIYVVLVSNAPCLTKQDDTSNAIKVIVHDNITPTLGITQSVQAGNSGTPISYTVTTPVLPPYTIQWFRNNTLATTTTGNVWNTSIQNSFDSVYAKIINFTGCYLTTFANSRVIKLGALSIGESVPVNFVVYPNPVAQIATIEGVNVGDELILFDMTGKTIFKDKITKTANYQLDMNGYASGVYQAKFVRDNQIWIVRIQKQ
jgi:hypothetical protein